MMIRTHRRLGVLRGPLAETAAAAVASMQGARTGLWVGVAPADWPFEVTDRRGLTRHLGRAFDGVVLDEPDGEALGRAHGCVRGGGRLILRLDPCDGAPGRWRRWLDGAIERAGGGVLVGPMSMPPEPSGGTAEQARVVEQLRALFAGPEGAVASVVADRGRGKSAALGLALRDFEGDAAITGPGPEATLEARRFAPGVPFVPLRELMRSAASPAVIVVDEAAQIPVSTLRQLVLHHGGSRVAFATTTRGYEGTGRGFVLRFLAWLEANQRSRRLPYSALTMSAPIRWGRDDPVERFVFDALLLDARPDPFTVGEALESLEIARLDPDALLSDEASLRGVFGLLVHAHYRTTPRDLELLLDGRGVHLYAMRVGGRVAAVNLLVEEGGLTPDVADALYRGTAGIRGQALPQTLAADCGRPDACGLSMLRSVRIATHPALRRRGLAARLTEAVHAAHRPDLFGTLFGATPSLVQFRRRLGYRLVRMGISAGRRAGEPAAVMIRPCSPPARALVDALHGALARDLPRQFELMSSDLIVEPSLVRTVLSELPAPRPLDRVGRDARVAAYAFGPCGFETVALPVLNFVTAHADALDRLDPDARALIEQRVVRGQSWAEIADRTGGVRAAMRGLRRAVRDLVRAVEPDLEGEF